MSEDDVQRLWTLRITGPQPFEFQAGASPSVEHNGGTTAVNLVLSQAEVGELKLRVAAEGCRLKAWEVAGQTEEQTEDRARFVGLGAEDRVWPSLTCPTCAWFDPLKGEGSPCGLDTLPPESLEVLRAESRHHQEAEKNCPVRGNDA